MRRVIVGLCAAGLAVLLARAVVERGQGEWSIGFDLLLYNGLMVAAALAVLARAVVRPPERAAWAILGVGIAAVAVGEILYAILYEHIDAEPLPSVSDIVYLAAYPLLVLGLVLLARSRLSRASGTVWVDAAIAVLCVSAVTFAAVQRSLAEAWDYAPAEAAFLISYPLADGVLLGLIAGVLAFVRWRPDRSLALMAAGIGAMAVADASFTYAVTIQMDAVGYLTEPLWPAGMLLIAAAAWTRPGPVSPGDRDAPGALLMPLAAALVALGVLVVDHIVGVGVAAFAGATLTLLAVIARVAHSVSGSLRRLAGRRSEALTDPLTGLANRRHLADDLQHLFADGQPASRPLLLLDLDGFKVYNDTCGHPAGDALLTLLGNRLREAVSGHGTAYRLGGDEFCVIGVDGADPDALGAAAREALTYSGADGSVGVSCGRVVLSREASTPLEALSMADQRLYRDKSSRRTGTLLPEIVRILGTLAEGGAPGARARADSVARLAHARAEAAGLDVRAAAAADAVARLLPAVSFVRPGTPWYVGSRDLARVLGVSPALGDVAHVLENLAPGPRGGADEPAEIAQRIVEAASTLGHAPAGGPAGGHDIARPPAAALPT